MDNKFIAAFVVVAMIVAIPAGIAVGDADATTDGATGTYSVYAYYNEVWSSDTVSAYDAAQAVQASDMWDDTTDSMVSKYTTGTWVTYNYDTYGDITTFMGKSNSDTSQWNVFIIDTTGAIVAADDCLGSYKCFSDYDLDHRTANIILYYAGSGVTVETVAQSYSACTSKVAQSSITAVTETAAYAVTFTLQITYSGVDATISGNVYDTSGNLVTDASLKASAVTVVGYGSDCYLALKDAVGSTNFTGEDTVPGSGYYAYGWMSDLFGLGTVQTGGTDTPDDWTDDSYAYWCIYDSTGTLADFVLGAYSPVETNSIFVCDSISLIYEEVGMSDF